MSTQKFEAGNTTGSCYSRPAFIGVLLPQLGRDGKSVAGVQEMRQRYAKLEKTRATSSSMLKLFGAIEGYHDDWQLVVELTMEVEAKQREVDTQF